MKAFFSKEFYYNTVGEWAIALGNPYGFLIKDSKPSVSVGVISAINRDFAENKDGNEELEQSIRAEVKALCDKFPIYERVM